MNNPCLFLSLFIIGATAMHGSVSQNQSQPGNKPLSLPEKIHVYSQLIDVYSRVRMPTGDGQANFYALIDMVSHDGFLELEHVCLRSFPLDYCFLVGQALTKKWALYNTAMKQDTHFVQLSTEVILQSMENDQLWRLLESTNLLADIFRVMATSKDTLFNAFNSIK
jgi:hypothetical protein